MSGTVIELKNVKHAFKMGNNEFPVINGISLSLKQGHFVSLLGKSGSGKSTLLNLIGGLMKPSMGEILVFDTDIAKLNENQLAEFRKDKLGFIFQSYNLIPTLNTFENVELPLIFQGMPPAERAPKVRAVLEMVGLSEHEAHKPGELSGGQQQRTSIARALVTEPSIVLADEPTGNLDTQTEEEVMAFIRRLNKERGITFLVVTHDEQVAQGSDRVIVLKDGIVVSDAGQEGSPERKAL